MAEWDMQKQKGVDEEADFPVKLDLSDEDPDWAEDDEEEEAADDETGEDNE